jgi:3-hydroxyacyl-[acyl-carrier-protein] dehydratase
MQNNDSGLIRINDIFSMLPHRYPFLLVDRVLEFTPMTSIRALKNVTVNEPHFTGHFPEVPIMPGVLILEAMAQAGAILLVNSIDEPVEGKIFMFTGIEKARFRKPVIPGDQLILECFDIKRRMTMVKMQATAKVDGKLAAEAVISAAMVDKSAV